MSLSKHDPSFQFSGNLVDPNEIDRYETYPIIKPSASLTFFGTAEDATGTGALTIDQGRADYPRNLRLGITGVAGGMGGTVAVVGKDQFGSAITESIGFGSAAGGGTAQGSLVFAEVTSAAVTGLAGLGGTAIGTIQLGAAISTSGDATTAKFGLPVKIGGTTDVKRATWIDNGTAKMEATSSRADAALHAWKPTNTVAAADDYILTIAPTFRNTSEVRMSNL